MVLLNANARSAKSPVNFRMNTFWYGWHKYILFK